MIIEDLLNGKTVKDLLAKFSFESAINMIEHNILEFDSSNIKEDFNQQRKVYFELKKCSQNQVSILIIASMLQELKELARGHIV